MSTFLCYTSLLMFRCDVFPFVIVRLNHLYNTNTNTHTRINIQWTWQFLTPLRGKHETKFCWNKVHYICYDECFLKLGCSPVQKCPCCRCWLIYFDNTVDLWDKPETGKETTGTWNETNKYLVKGLSFQIIFHWKVHFVILTCYFYDIFQ